MNPLVSVIVPIYKVEKYIERCARSLLEQTLEDLEFIFVNDSTPDGSIEVLKRVIEAYPQREAQVRIIEHERNMGLWKARTTGIKEARGEYIIHCDSDDWVETDMYEKMSRTAIAEQADIVCCGYWAEYSLRKVLYLYSYEYETRQNISECKWEVIYCSLWNKLIRRDLYTENHILPFKGINMWEDLGMTIRLRYFSRKTVILPEAFYHYNKQNENSIVSVSKLSSIEEQLHCAICIGEFFRQQGECVEKQFKITIFSLKFKAKGGFLFNKSLRDMKRWLATFPETHRDIWKYTDLPWNMRLEGWLAVNGMVSLSCFLIDVKTFVSNRLRKCYRGN